MKKTEFQELLGAIKKHPENKSNCEKYEKTVETLDGKGIDEVKFYREYYSKIEVISYHVPEELKDDFDWDLLGRLVIGSFSSLYTFLPGAGTSNLPELWITVKSNGVKVTKSVSELWSFQIQRLFEIYINEALSLQTLHDEDSGEERVIDAERSKLLKKWHEKLTCLNRNVGCDRLSEIRDQIGKFIES